MRGQWVNYDNFNLIELIDEVKTRIEEPFRVNDTLHGALVVGKDYYGLCKELRDFLERDDKRSTDTKQVKNIGILTYSPLTEDKKKILEELMGSASSKQIDFNKVRDEWREENE